MSTDIFATWAPIYRELGLWPRPVKPGTKACKLPRWQRPDDEIDQAELKSWLTKYARFGIGLVMGTPLPDGTLLGALDIDRDEYVGLGRALLRNPPCGRFGSKGAVYFVRVVGKVENAEFKVTNKPSLGKVAECLFVNKFCVIPPTVHPSTNAAYAWIGTPLHEMNFDDLPLVEF